MADPLSTHTLEAFLRKKLPQEPSRTIIEEDTPVLIGVSGGVDSIVLLDLASKIFAPSRLRALHVHHGLRGEEANRDACFVQELTHAYNIPFFVKQGNVRELAANQRLSLETAAREFRYTCFDAWSYEFNASYLLLAHHANDQAETILYNLCRGSAGLKGIPPIAQKGHLTLLRPLISHTRDEIEAYALHHELNWCHDSTNDEMIAVRNELRHNIIPELNRIFQRPVAPLLNRAEELSREIDQSLTQALDQLPSLDPQGRLYLPTLLTYPPALQRSVLHWYLKNKGISEITQRLIDSAFTLLTTSGPSKINLPGNYTLKRKEKRLFIEKIPS